jgi:phosphoserine phosphatase
MSRRLLVVLDVDSTLTRDEGIDLLATHASQAAAAEVATITAQAMRGELDFAQSLTRRVRQLEGIPEDVLRQVADTITLTTGARELVSTLHAHGHLVGVVSGGFHELIDPLAFELGLDFTRANRLGVSAKVLNGELVGPIIDAQAKADALREWAAQSEIPIAQTVAVGDGGNDVVMLRDAGLGIAFMAKPIAREAADVALDTPDLSEVLGLLGLPRS